MRKLRKGESYALLRSIDIAPFKTRRSPLRCAHRDDGDITGVVQSKRCIPPIVYHTKLVTLLIFFICVLFSEAQAQSAGERAAADGLEHIKPLEIGDVIPEEIWQMPLQVVNHPEGKDTITLNDYRDKKLIILDFWATWCAPCIESLLHLDSLKRSFVDDLLVLPSTYENNQVTSSFLSKRQISFSSIVGVSNEYLKQYFPHRMVPHQIWIADSKVNAITSHQEATRENMESVIRGNDAKLTVKSDLLEYDFRKPIYPFAIEDLLISAHTLSKHIEGAGSMVTNVIVDGKRFVTYSNCSLLRLYAQSLGVPIKKLHIDTEKRDLFYYSCLGQKDNIVCYQLIVPQNYLEDRINDYIIRSLNLELDFCGKWDSIEMDCWVIRDTGGPAQKVKEIRKGVELDDLVYRLNNSEKIASPLLVNECNREITISGIFSLNDLGMFHNLEQLLSSYGLILERSVRTLAVYRIQDNIASNHITSSK